MLILAETILRPEGEPLSNGFVRVNDNRITDVGTRDSMIASADETVVDLGASILSPGLINAHCHLDYTHFKGSILPASSFTEWIKTINGLKRHFKPQDYLDAIVDGYRLLLDSGTTSVLNIEAFPDLLPKLDTPPLRVWWFLELIDVRNRLTEDATLLGALSFFESHPEWLGGFGLSPHAPYTASIQLFRLARHCSEKYGMPFTTHIAESIEEQEMFLHGRGPLYDFLSELGRDCSDCGQGSSLSHLIEHGVISSDCLAVHMNYLQEYDWEPFRDTGASIVHCPKCHTYFGHQAFPLEQALRYKLNVCLGTDSLASNNTLDMRSEIREAQLHHPGIAPRDWFDMVTRNPARALRLSGKLGEISPGALADLVAFPNSGKKDPYSELIESRKPPIWIMINGKIRANQ